MAHEMSAQSKRPSAVESVFSELRKVTFGKAATLVLFITLPWLVPYGVVTRLSDNVEDNGDLFEPEFQLPLILLGYVVSFIFLAKFAQKYAR